MRHGISSFTRAFARTLTRSWILVAALALSCLGATLTPSQAQDPTWGTGKGAKGVTGRYATVNGIKLYYQVHGTGRPLVLLHGGLGAIEMFGENLPALAKGRQVIAVDLQGHGRTADVDRPLSTEAMGDDIAALIRHLGLVATKVDVVGYSLGGGVALQTALRHPELVGNLVLISTPFRRDGYYPEILGMQGQVNAAAAEGMKQTPMYQVYSALAPRPEDWPRLLQKIGDFMQRDYDLTREIARITAPTLVVAGDADIFPPAHAVELFGLLGGGKRDGGWDGSGRPKSSLAIVPGATHYSLFSDPRLAPIVLTFLDQRAPAKQ